MILGEFLVSFFFLQIFLNMNSLTLLLTGFFEDENGKPNHYKRERSNINQIKARVDKVFKHLIPQIQCYVQEFKQKITDAMNGINRIRNIGITCLLFSFSYLTFVAYGTVTFIFDSGPELPCAILNE